MYNISQLAVNWEMCTRGNVDNNRWNCNREQKVIENAKVHYC